MRKNNIFNFLFSAVIFLTFSSLLLACYLNVFVFPKSSNFSNNINLDNYNKNEIWRGSSFFVNSPCSVSLLSSKELPETSNLQRFAFEFSHTAPFPTKLERSLRIKAESNITILRFGKFSLRAQKTSDRKSLYLEAVFQVNGVFNVSFFWNYFPLFSCHLKIDTIDILLENQSMMKCNGGHYNDRWCEVWNVCWKWKRFHFYSDTATYFKIRIAYPGSRPIPNDYLSCRIIFRIIAHRYKTMYDFSREIENIYNATSFLTCRWNGMQHFWHILFDFTIPLWWTMKMYNSTKRGKNRIFTLDDNDSQKGYLFCDSLSDQKVENIRNLSHEKLSCWKHAIVGVPKAERYVQPEKWPNGYDLPYEYPHDAVIGMREHFLQFYNGNESVQSIENRCQPNPKNPRVLITFRFSEKRHIINKMELVDAMKKWCPECQVDYNYMRNITIQQQLNMICNTSLLIGIHGGGLSHMVFQKPSSPEAPTAAIEILPYKYTCRNWYRFAAMTAKVRYFHWLNNIRENTVPTRGKKTSKCYTTGECLSDQCHDFLRDQLTTVDLEGFEKVFMKAIKYVKKESPFLEVDLANQTDETATVL